MIELFASCEIANVDLFRVFSVDLKI